MTPAAAPPKRTRRLENPFDARLEVRMYSTELALLRRNAAERGLSASDLVRQQLGKLIAANPPEAPERPEKPESAESPPEPTPAPQALSTGPAEADLAEAIAAVTDRSWGYASLQIKLGKVSVGGKPWTAATIPYEHLAHLELDGEPLPIEAIEQTEADYG